MTDLFDSALGCSVPVSIFDKDRHHWSETDYKKAFMEFSDRALNFSFMVITRRLLVSPAYCCLSPRAAKLLMACFNATTFESNYRDIRHVSKHGEKPCIKCKDFMLPYNQCRVFGIRHNSQIKQAFTELQALGFIEQIGPSRRNHPNVYRHVETYLSLTWDQAEDIQKRLKSKIKGTTCVL